MLGSSVGASSTGASGSKAADSGGAGGASRSISGGAGGALSKSIPGGAGGASNSGGAGGASISGGASIGGGGGRSIPGGAGGASSSGGAGGASISGGASIGGGGGRSIPGGAGGASIPGGAGGISIPGGAGGSPGGGGGISSLISFNSIAIRCGYPAHRRPPYNDCQPVGRPFGLNIDIMMSSIWSVRGLKTGEPTAGIMAVQDSTSPPVLFVVGTAGAGKSSLTTALQRWARFLEVDTLTINLDPGAERVHHDPEFDVRDLVSLSEVMDEYDLGPNGAQILAADLVAAQAHDIAEELEGLTGDVMIIDTPGQVELFAFREASSHMIEVLGNDQAAVIYLFDPMLSRSPSGFVSQMLLSSIVEFRLGLPTKNFLSKCDLLDEGELEKIMEWGERLEILEMALYDEAGGQRTEFAINQLRLLQNFAQNPGLTPLSSELEEGLADILSFAEALFGGMGDSRDGFASDIEHERDTIE